jgi:hypothetical protein
MERCWDERRGLFFDLATRSERRVEVSTWSSLAPLALRALPEDVRRRLVEEHLLDPRRYRAPVGIPSVSMEALLPRRFRPELGYEEAANRIVHTLADAVEREGFREYFNVLTGRGHGARDFGWSTLLVDL